MNIVNDVTSYFDEILVGNTLVKAIPAVGDELILAGQKMVDFSKEITLKTDNGTFKKKVQPSAETMSRTLLERGDPNYIFPGEIVIENK